MSTPGALATLPPSPAFGSPQVTVGLNPWNAAVADLDGDGYADVATADAGSGGVSVVRGTGSGLFRPPAHIATGDQPRGIAAADLDGDGAPELVVAHWGSNDLVVLHGLGDGTFARGGTYPLGGSGEDVATGDVNGDGAADVLVATSSGTQAMAVFLGDGHGGLTRTADTYAGGSSGIALGDLNGDGRADVALAGGGATHGIRILLGGGDGTFHAGDDVTTGGTPFKVALGDVDGDGDLDVAAPDADSGTVLVSLNAGDGTFGHMTALHVGSTPIGIVAGDLTGDGRAELVSSDSAVPFGGGSLSVISPRADGHFDVQTFVGPSTPFAVALAHLDAGPLLDAVVVSGQACRLGCIVPGKVTALLNTGGGRLGGYTVYDTSSGSGGSSCPWASEPARTRAIAVSDLNGDGRLDLAVARCEAGDVTLLLNDGAGGFAPGGHLNPDGGAPDAIAAGDLNGDGLSDLAVVYDTVAVSVHLNTGGARFTGPPLRIGQTLRRPFVFVADMNGDGANDVVFGGQATAGPAREPVDVVVALGDGHGAFPTKLYTLIEPAGDYHHAALVDLDGDGDPDLVTTDEEAHSATVLLNDGSGRLVRQPPVSLPAGSMPTEVAAGDVDGDGDNDVVVSDPGSNAVRLLTNDGAGGLAPSAVYPAGDEVYGVALVDVNADGRPDLVYAQPLAVLQPEASVVVRLNEGGTFGDPVSYLAGDGARHVLGAQLNGAGGPELVVTDESRGQVWVLDSGRARTGFFIDLDIDYVPDLLELNLGLDPKDPDTDDDGILDGFDPSVITIVVSVLPKSVFSPSGRQQQLLDELAKIERSIGKGQKPKALKDLLELGGRFDGCRTGKAPDKDDWIRDCGAQDRLRLPFALVVSNLKGVPLPQEYLPPPPPQD